MKNALDNRRIDSIDILRGIVMVLMALDHTRDYYLTGIYNINPTDLEHTYPMLFFTRWITHFCAPVFILLSGTAAFLYQNKKGRKATSVFLLTRGIWLILLELTIVRVGWNMNPLSHSFMLQVIWVIGASMVVMSAVIWLRTWMVLAIGLSAVSLHNLMDGFVLNPDQPFYILWSVFENPQRIYIGPFRFFTLYPVLPWLGVMAVGYVMGKLFVPGYPTIQRQRVLFAFGAFAIMLFLLLRSTNLYGNPTPWSEQKDTVFTLLSFLDLEKYPPSFLFLLMALGPALWILPLLERVTGRAHLLFKTIGQVPLFYYVVHLYVIHLSSLAIHALFGKGENGWPLWVTYVAWICIVALLYPLCKWYGKIKRNSTWIGWSYL